MSMTKKDFEVVADVLAEARTNSGSPDFALYVSVRMAEAFEKAYPRFDKAKFLGAIAPNTPLPAADGEG